MAKFNSLEDIFADIEREIAEALLETGNETSRNMQQIISSLVYNGYTPLVYRRTGNLRESPRIIKISSTSMTVGVDDDRDRGFEGTATMSEIIDRFTRGTVIMQGSEYEKGQRENNYREPIPLAQELMKELNRVEEIFISKLKHKLPLNE